MTKNNKLERMGKKVTVIYLPARTGENLETPHSRWPISEMKVRDHPNAKEEECWPLRCDLLQTRNVKRIKFSAL
jgi:hypothetical protein